MSLRKWDRGVDYHEIKARIKRRIARARALRSRCYAKILYLQLLNGSRISEALRAAHYFSLHPNALKAEVLLSKSKSLRKRLMIRPRDLDFTECRGILEELMEAGIRDATKKLKVYAYYKLKVNTHSLRYAFITRMLSRGFNPAFIARIVGHTKLDRLLTYTQERKAAEILEELVLGE